jgi:hypothetical protein
MMADFVPGLPQAVQSITGFGSRVNQSSRRGAAYFSKLFWICGVLVACVLARV